MVSLTNALGFAMQVAVVNPGWQVIHKMKLSRLVDKIGAQIFLTVNEAVEAVASSAIKQENSDIVWWTPI